MARSETVKFEFRHYTRGVRAFENDLVAKLPGLLISQFHVSADSLPTGDAERTALRFDFFDDWYNVLAFFDTSNRPIGHYRIGIQTPLESPCGTWCGDDLLLALEVFPGLKYRVTGEKEFLAAVEDGWMRVYTAANARDTLRGLCAMLDSGHLPQEVMDAVVGW